MTIKVESVMKKDLVTLLSDVDIEYVSHVPNGANRIPYKFLKSEATASDVAKEIVDLLKILVDEQVEESSTLTKLPEDSNDLPDEEKGLASKLNESVSDQHKQLLNFKEQLRKISPSDLDGISNEHLDDLKKVLHDLQKSSKSTVKYDEDQARNESGQFASGSGGSSSPSPSSSSRSSSVSDSIRSARDSIRDNVTRATAAVHEHAVNTGKVAQKVATISSVAATVLKVIAPIVPHPAIKAGMMVASKVAAGVAIAAEGVAVAAHVTEMGVKPKDEEKRTKKSHDDESATKHWDKKTDELINVTKNPKGQPRLDKLPLKSDTGEGAMSLEVIHSIIQPVGKDIRALEELYPEWFRNVKLSEKVESEDKVVFIQKSDEAFDESAFRFLDAGYGLEFKVGKLKRTEKSDDALLIPTQISPMKDDMTVSVDPSLTPDTAANLNPDPMDTPIVEQPANEQPAPAYPIAPDLSLPPTTETYTFGDMFQSKLNAFASAVVAAMELSEDPVTRRKLIQTFWKSFGNFLNAALDRVDSNTAKSDGTEPTTITKDETDTEQNDTGGFDMSELFATKDEMKAFIIDTVKTALKEEKESASATPAEPQPVEKSDVDQLAEITQKLEGLTETIKGFDTIKAELTVIKEKTESLAHGTGPRRSWSEDVQSTTATQKSEPHVMNGVFTAL
jgi:hypothetical protein